MVINVVERGGWGGCIQLDGVRTKHEEGWMTHKASARQLLFTPLKRFVIIYAIFPDTVQQ